MNRYLINIAASTTIFLATARPGLAGAPEALQEKGAPTLDELANASYQGIYEEPVRLDGGVYEGEPFAEGGASRPRVELVRDFRMAGDVDGEGGEEAVVLLSESSGGSGTHLYMAVVGRREEMIVNLATVLVGDRTQVRAARLTDNRIELNVVQAGPEDAACCPSQKATRTWTLRSSGLRESKPAITGTLSLADLEGPVWILTHLGWNERVPEEPEITLVVEGLRVTGTGGCNRYFSQVEERAPGEMSMGPIGSTQRACPDAVMKLESRFLKALGGAMKYSFFPGKLALTVRVDNVYKTLLFVPRGEEVEPEANGRRSIIEDAKRRGVDFYAAGNEPGWTLEIGTEEIVFQTNYGQETYRFPTPEPEVDPEKLRTVYRVQSAGHDLVVEILGLACADNMSGEKFESTVQITFDGRTHPGCGLMLN
jgi:heat shock protein HslJ